MGNLVIVVLIGSGGRLLLFVLVCSLREVLCRASAPTVSVGVCVIEVNAESGRGGFGVGLCVDCAL